MPSQASMHQTQELMLELASTMVRSTCSVDMVVNHTPECPSTTCSASTSKLKLGRRLSQSTILQMEEVDTVFSQATRKSTSMVDGIKKCNTTVFSSTISTPRNGLIQISTMMSQDGITVPYLLKLSQLGNSSSLVVNKLSTMKEVQDPLVNTSTQVLIWISEP